MNVGEKLHHSKFEIRYSAVRCKFSVRPDYLLVRQRVVGNLWEKLIAIEKQWIKGDDRRGWVLTLLPEPREHLRSVLASYWGHFSHACHYRLAHRIFTRFPWLTCLFELRNDRFVPLWQPSEVSSYKSQQRYFQHFFAKAEIRIQRGCQFDKLPAVSSLRVVSEPEKRENMENVRFAVSKIIVRQQGYLKGGLRRRCVESFTFLPSSSTGVSLCASFVP